MAKKTKVAKAPKIWPITMLPIEQLVKDEHNTNKQDHRVFKDLRNNISEEGIDENLIVVPIGTEDAPLYKIVSGNHRRDAAAVEGYTVLPCVVRTDWTKEQAATQSVRRNIARGEIDPVAFTNLVQELQSEHQLTPEEIQAQMGFVDEAKFLQHIQKNQLFEDHAVGKAHEEAEKTDGSRGIKLLDELGLVLSHIFDEYGDTVPYSFVVFPAGGKRHMFIQTNKALKDTLTQIATQCITTGQDLTSTLNGLLVSGLASTKFVDVAVQRATLSDTDDFEKIIAQHFEE